MNFPSLRSLERFRPPLVYPLLALPLLLACDEPHPEGHCTSFGNTRLVSVKFESRSGAAWSPGPYRVTVTIDGVEGFCDFEVPEPPCTDELGPDDKRVPEPVCTAQYFLIGPGVYCDSRSLTEGKYELAQVLLRDATPASLDVDLSYRGETLVKGTLRPAYTIEEARGNICSEPRDRATVGLATLSLP
jgi:hypothetical protein